MRHPSNLIYKAFSLVMLFVFLSVSIACKKEVAVSESPLIVPPKDTISAPKPPVTPDDNFTLFTDEMNTRSSGCTSDWRAENAYSTFKVDYSGTTSMNAHINFDNQVPNVKGRCEIHKPLLSGYTCPIGDERVVTIKMRYFLPSTTETGNVNVGGCVGQIMAWDYHRIIPTATTKPTDVAYIYLISLYMRNNQIYFQPNHEIYDQNTLTYHDYYVPPANNQVIYNGSFLNKPVEIEITTKFSRTANGYVIGTAKFDGDTTIYRKEIRDIVTYGDAVPVGDPATRLEWKVGCYCAGNYKSYHAQVNIDRVSSKVEK